MTVPSLAFLFCAAQLFAQQNVTVLGIVTDADFGVPVADAKVELHYVKPNLPLDTAATSAAGTFELSVKESGKYSVAASAPGYLETLFDNDRSGIAIEDAEFEQGASPVTHRVELKLTRSGILAGLVRDGDTREPIRLVPVRAIRLWWRQGQREATEEGLLFTDDKGEFRIYPLPPGEYVVMLGNTTAQAQLYPPGATGPRPKAYPMRVFPDSDADSLVPITLRAGAEFNLGALDYSKIVPPRILVPSSKPDAECPPQPMSEIHLDQKIAGALFSLSSVSGPVCGMIRQLPVLSRGTYRLNFVANWPDGFHIGEEEIRIRDGEDAEAKMQLTPPTNVTGKVACECEKALNPADRVDLQIYPFPFGHGGMFGSINGSKDGTFSGLTFVSGAATISVHGIPDGLVLKRLSFNGKETGSFITVIPGAASTIEVLLSDKPSTLNGTVDRDGKPTLHDHVVVAKWPTPAGATYVDFTSAVVNANGGFSVGNLAPGMYRATSVGPEQWQRRDMPDAVAEWLASMDDITIEAGETKSIRIDAKLP